MTPADMAVGLEDELSSDLPEVATREHFAARAQFLNERLCCQATQRLMHVIGSFAAEREGPDHAKIAVEFFRWVGVNRIRRICFFDVHGDHIRCAAANDDEICRDGERREKGRGQFTSECADVFLTILEDGEMSVGSPAAIGTWICWGYILHKRNVG